MEGDVSWCVWTYYESIQSLAFLSRSYVFAQTHRRHVALQLMHAFLLFLWTPGVSLCYQGLVGKFEEGFLLFLQSQEQVCPKSGGCHLLLAKGVLYGPLG